MVGIPVPNRRKEERERRLPTRTNMAGESIAQYMERRKRELQSARRDAEAWAHEAYRRTIRAGDALNLATPSEVITYGRNLIQGAPPKPPAKPDVKQAGNRAAAASPRTGGGSRPASLDQNRAAKGAGGALALDIGKGIGLAQGVWHAAEGLYNGAGFVQRLLDPMDVVKSPPGASAGEQLVGAGRRLATDVRQAASNPQQTLEELKDRGRQAVIALDPKASPMAETFTGELRRNFDIGRNQGEAAFNVGSLLIGGPGAKMAGRLGQISNVGRADKYIAQVFSPKAAAYLAEPYVGMGHHFVPRRTKFIPNEFSKSEFNVLKPEGISRGDFYERHYRVDPSFYGTRLSKKLAGETWRGSRLGLEKYDLAGRLWFGSPAPLKARAGGIGVAFGAPTYQFQSEEQKR